MHDLKLNTSYRIIWSQARDDNESCGELLIHPPLGIVFKDLLDALPDNTAYKVMVSLDQINHFKAIVIYP